MPKKTVDAGHRHLRKDPRMRDILKRYALQKNTRPKDPFAALARSIVYQQISGKAASAIFSRFLALFPQKAPTPRGVARLKDEALRSAGLSAQKILYLRDLAKRFEDGTVKPELFPKMSDEEIREHLLVIKGIGRWTADMFLIFTLKRPDVLPTGDLGVQRGFRRVFGMKKNPSPKQMEKLAETWRPYRTLASLYLWRVADGDAEGDW